MRTEFTEIDHTADLSIKAWGSTLEELFFSSLKGMYSLQQADISVENKTSKVINLEATDIESLMVSFLSEMLFILEEEQLGALEGVLEIKKTVLKANLELGQCKSMTPRIKAVTFHDLDIRIVSGKYETKIVFDV